MYDLQGYFPQKKGLRGFTQKFYRSIYEKIIIVSFTFQITLGVPSIYSNPLLSYVYFSGHR